MANILDIVDLPGELRTVRVKYTFADIDRYLTNINGLYKYEAYFTHFEIDMKEPHYISEIDYAICLDNITSKLKGTESLFPIWGHKEIALFITSLIVDLHSRNEDEKLPGTLGKEFIDTESTLYRLYTTPYKDYYEKVEVTNDVYKKPPLAVNIDGIESESTKV